MKERSAWLPSILGAVLILGCKPTILAPEENEVVYVPVEMSVRVRHGSGAGLEYAFERSELEIPGQWPQPRTEVALTPNGVTQESATITATTVTITEAGSWYLRARENEPDSPWSDWRSVVALQEGLSTAGATIGVTPSAYNGPCPVNINVKGTIGSAVAGVVVYHFARSDGVDTPTQNWTFDAPGTIAVKTNMPSVGDGSPPNKGWVALVVRSQNGPEVMSLKAGYNVVCTP